MEKFWLWYERHYRISLAITAFLFTLQIVHLIWLATDIVLPAIIGTPHVFAENSFARIILALVDYTEIPALISVNILYLRHLKISPSFKHYTYLVFINLQWAHLFWITDEIILETFGKHGVTPEWNVWLAVLAIGIDYLELPVIYETLREFSRRFLRKAV
ncbi:MAG: hypothetical protein Q7S83_00835 [bacterium]|nr:hypothetical protein [bacterium]